MSNDVPLVNTKMKVFQAIAQMAEPRSSKLATELYTNIFFVTFFAFLKFYFPGIFFTVG